MKRRKITESWIVVPVVIFLVIMAIVGVMTFSYPKKIKNIFVQSSQESMEKKLNEAALYINDNIEMNYEEIRLLAGLIANEVDGSDEYSQNVLNTMQVTMKNAGFTSIGILRKDSGHLFATMSDGKKVQLDSWVISMDFDEDDVSVELQTSPFSSLDNGSDAVVYRYHFTGNEGGEYIIVAEKTIETLNSMLNVEPGSDGLTMIVRNNGNVVFSMGKLGGEEVDSYNFYAKLSKYGADDARVDEIRRQMNENDAASFNITIGKEPYYFVSHKINNTDWICVNAYSETVMAGGNLSKVNRDTMVLVGAVTIILIVTFLFLLHIIRNAMKKESDKNRLETERLFEEMSRHIPMAFAIIRQGDNIPKFVSYNFYDIIGQGKFNFSKEGIVNWVKAGLTEDTSEELDKMFETENVKYEQIILLNDNYYSVGLYSIGVIDDYKHSVLIINNITSDMETKNLLEDSMNRADAASKSKTAFLSKMSHEIRTPLNSVLGFSRLALDGWDTLPNSELKDYMNKIQISGNYLLELVSDILDISRIEEGRMQISKNPCSLDSMVNEIVDSFQGQMERKHHQFVVDKNYKDVVLNMDSFHTKQILNNLISNACKYTDEDGVVGFEISTKMLDNKKVAVQYIIQDTGIGMSEEFQKKIFEPFTQEDRGLMMKKQLRGSGLGMSICKNLVDLQDGTIKLESTLGEGSCFTVVLTYDIADENIIEDNKQKTDDFADCEWLKGKRALIVDDVDMNRIFMGKVLEKLGMSYDEAADGKQAVEMFEKSAAGEYFAIFMDVNMPVMSGYEATEIIRKMQRKDAKSILIAGMTADAFSDDVNKALISGMNYHISKPIQIERVMKALINHYNGKKQ